MVHITRVLKRTITQTWLIIAQYRTSVRW